MWVQLQTRAKGTVFKILEITLQRRNALRLSKENLVSSRLRGRKIHAIHFDTPVGRCGNNDRY